MSTTGGAYGRSKMQTMLSVKTHLKLLLTPDTAVSTGISQKFDRPVGKKKMDKERVVSVSNIIYLKLR